MSATPDSTLANPEQRIADLERQLAECQSDRDQAQQQLAKRTIERDEAHAQQTATAEVLQVINSSPGGLQPVFEAMLGHAIRLCDANFGHFRTYDGKGFPLAAVHGESDLVELHQQRFRHFVPGPHHPISRLVRGERLIHIADAAADEAYHNDPDWPQLVATGARSVLAVALRKGDTLLGYINVYREAIGPFTDKQVALLENFAAQAVIAIENARLITETREALEQQTATAEVLGVISSCPGELQPVFDAMLGNAGRLCDCVLGGMFLYQGGGFRDVAMLNVTPDFATIWRREASHPAPTTALARLVQSKKAVQIDDLMLYEGYTGGEPLHVSTVDVFGARTVLAQRPQRRPQQTVSDGGIPAGANDRKPKTGGVRAAFHLSGREGTRHSAHSTAVVQGSVSDSERGDSSRLPEIA